MFIITHLTDYVKKGMLSMNDLILMRKIFINEINSINSSLIRHATNCDWDMFRLYLQDRGAYIDLALKLGLINFDEYRKIRCDDKFEMMIDTNV